MPLFLSSRQIMQIHSFSIRRFGGEDGIRDAGLLDSAINAPSAGMDGTYFHEDIFAMAAAYLFHIAMNHPFVDGNKRTAALAALAFLEQNMFTINLPEPALAELVIAVTEGRADKAAVGACFRDNAVADCGYC